MADISGIAPGTSTSQAHLKAWIESSTRADLIARVQPLLLRRWLFE